MNLVGYLVTLANIQNFHAGGGSVKDVSIEMGNVVNLVELMAETPEFSLDCFRQNGFCKIGNTGKYLSMNVRNYLYNGDLDPTEEGLVLTLVYSDEPKQEGDDPTPPTTLFLHKGEVSDEIKANVQDYLDRGKRSIKDLFVSH